MNKEKEKAAGRERRRARVKSRIRGTAQTPRLSVYRSLKHLYAQLIDDERGVTLAAASDAHLVGADKDARGIERAAAVGALIAAKAAELKIEKVVFDRGPFAYHGRVKAVADAARKAGLKF